MFLGKMRQVERELLIEWNKIYIHTTNFYTLKQRLCDLINFYFCLLILLFFYSYKRFQKLDPIFPHTNAFSFLKVNKDDENISVVWDKGQWTFQKTSKLTGS